MSANTQDTGNGRKNYYSVSYGKLSTRLKTPPKGFTEIAEATLKANVQEFVQQDLRKKYVNKGTGDYPYNVFYDSLTGVILSQEKFENDNGTNLNLTILDTDGDTSILQVKFYSKYAENLLNRLLNVDTTKEFTFFPYAIINSAEIDGKNKTFYTQGVSVKSSGVKIEPKYKADDKTLPATEQVKVQGKMQTSRDARLDFLYSEFVKHFTPNSIEPQQKVETPKNTVPTATPKQAFEPTNSSEEEFQDLPF